MNKPDTNTPVSPNDFRERLLIFLLCALGAVHVFIYSAGFPFFGSVDEDCHFDLVVKYSQGDLPRTQGPFCDEALPYLVCFGTAEYLPASVLIGHQYPPPLWLLPKEQAGKLMAEGRATGRQVRNHESSQPPLYYLLAGLCWRVERVLNLNDGFALYGLRFLNCLVVAVLVWMGHVAARMLFPQSLFIRIGVPALIAFIPQTAFYSLQNDVLSPLCFGAVFIGLLLWMREEALTFRLAAFTGLAFAATYLTKLSNAPLLAVAAAVAAFNLWRQFRKGTLRATLRALAVFAFCAGAPTAAWLAWMKHNFGDFTGTAAKIQVLGWTVKPFNEWWQHPVFTPSGAWIFLSGLFGTFWQGQLNWHGLPLPLPLVNNIYTVFSLALVGVALAGLLSHAPAMTGLQRRGLWFSLACLVAGIMFLVYVSIIYDFNNSVEPSREHPYFISGRVLLGALIPFLLLLLYGLDGALAWIKNPCVRPAALVAIILFMLISEIATNFPVFSSQYNWFHM